MPLEGQHIDRYQILQLLGGGGMGDVYLAEDPHIGQQVAIKVIRGEPGAYPDVTSPKEAAQLFYREVKAIGKLDHPYILPLYDYGEERVGGLFVIYLVMPYRPEGSLAQWLAQRPQQKLLPPRDVSRLVHQAADALQHAHDHRIIHQDVKPSNFLIRERKDSPGYPDILLSDFGIARLMTTIAMTSQTTRGTPTYMAPEQCLGHAVPASDQYSLAIMTYELLTGRPPFLGGPLQVMFQQIHDEPHPPGSLNPSLSKEVDQILLRTLSKQSSERFDSISAFSAAFEQAVQNLPQSDHAVSAPSSPTLDNPPSTGEMHAELAISAAEAQLGTTRTITLPGGQTLSVKVPAGVQDGHIVRLDSQVDSSTGDDIKNIVLLTIRIKQESDSLSPASSLLAQSTELLPRTDDRPSGVIAVSEPDESTLLLADARSEQDKSTILLAGAQLEQPTVPPIPPVETPAIQPPVGAVSPDTPTEGAIASMPTPGHNSRYPRWVLVALPALVLLLIAGGVLVAVINPFRSISPLTPLAGANSLATVMITPASKKLTNTYSIIAVTTVPDASMHQVAARVITTQTSPQSQTVPATGTTTIAATHATGILTLYNYSTTASVTLTAGTDIPNQQAVPVDMILDGNVTVPPATDPTNPPTGNVPAHVAQAGTIGNLPTVNTGSAGFYYCTNCSGNSVLGYEIENDSPFSGGREAQTATVVQQKDINGAVNSLETSNAPNPQQVLQSQAHAGEQLIGTPQCKPQETSDHQP